MSSYRFIGINRLFTLRSIVTAFDVIHPQGYYFSGEIHDFWEIVCVYDGSAGATAEEKVYSLTAGQILFHPPMEFHRVWAPPETPVHLLIISFRADGAGMDYFRQNKLFTLDSYERERFREVNHAFSELLSLQNRPESTDFSCAGSHAAVLFEEFLLRLYGNQPQPAESGSRYAETYGQVVRLLNERYRENPGLAEIAQLCGLSVSNLKRIFRMYSDKGVMQYFHSVKIRKAMQELDAGETITQVSDRLGYSSPSYFHAAFRRETGQTPREYQKRNGG